MQARIPYLMAATLGAMTLFLSNGALAHSDGHHHGHEKHGHYEYPVVYRHTPYPHHHRPYGPVVVGSEKIVCDKVDATKSDAGSGGKRGEIAGNALSVNRIG